MASRICIIVLQNAVSNASTCPLPHQQHPVVMTVAYLWKEPLKGYKQKNTFPISDINGKRIAVDFSAILHKIMAPKESKSSASVCLQLEPKYPPEEVVAKFEFYHNRFVQNKAVPLYDSKRMVQYINRFPNLV